jgi:hypothetical protein
MCSFYKSHTIEQRKKTFRKKSMNVSFYKQKEMQMNERRGFQEMNKTRDEKQVGKA